MVNTSISIRARRIGADIYQLIKEVIALVRHRVPLSRIIAIVAIMLCAICQYYTYESAMRAEKYAEKIYQREAECAMGDEAKTEDKTEAKLEELREALTAEVAARAANEQAARTEQAEHAKNTEHIEHAEHIAVELCRPPNRTEIVLDIGGDDPFIESVFNNTKDMIYVKATSMCSMFTRYIGKTVTLNARMHASSVYAGGTVFIKNVRIAEVINVTLPGDLIDNVERSCTPCGSDWASIRSYLTVSWAVQDIHCHCNFKDTSEIYRYFSAGNAVDILARVAPNIMTLRDTNQCGNMIVAPSRFSYIFNSRIKRDDSQFKIESTTLPSVPYIPQCFVRIA